LQQAGAAPRNAHLLRHLRLLCLLLVRGIDADGLLAHDLGLLAAVSNRQGDAGPHGALRTFSMANSSSALTWISRAFSMASCLMKATYGERGAGISALVAA
jgi:hypothetical protein